MSYPSSPDESVVRCPNCSAANPVGAAYCEVCATPLTAYETGGGQGPSAATLAKLQRLSIRPRIVPIMAAALVLGAFAYPFRIALTSLLAQRGASAAGSEFYIFNALGAVGAFLVALVMVPVGVFMLVTAWGTWRQQSWAWTADVILLGLAALDGLRALFGSSLAALPQLGVAAALLYAWLLPATREWYGKND